MANKAREMSCEIYPNPNDGRETIQMTLKEMAAVKRTAYQLGYNEGYAQGNHDAKEVAD